LTPEINNEIEMRMRQIVEGVCRAHEVTASISYETVFEPTINAPVQTEAAAEVARLLFGADKVNDKAEPKLFSEDFAHMYDFNDKALVGGSSYWVELVENRLA